MSALAAATAAGDYATAIVIVALIAGIVAWHWIDRKR